MGPCLRKVKYHFIAPRWGFSAFFSNFLMYRISPIYPKSCFCLAGTTPISLIMQLISRKYRYSINRTYYYATASLSKYTACWPCVCLGELLSRSGATNRLHKDNTLLPAATTTTGTDVHKWLPFPFIKYKYFLKYNIYYQNSVVFRYFPKTA
jgi:hypothetical protein